MWKPVSVSLWGNFLLTIYSRNVQSKRLNSIYKSFELIHCAIINKAKQNLLTGLGCFFFFFMTSAPYFLIWVPANLQPFVKQKGRTLLYPFLSVLAYQNKQPLLIHPRNLERWIVVMMNATDLQSPIMLTKGSFSFGVPGCSLCKNRWLTTRIDYLQILRPFSELKKATSLFFKIKSLIL